MGRPRTPGTTSYVALLASTAAGAICGTIMTAPIADIAEAMATDTRGMIVPISAFSVALVVVSPVAGWLSETIGPKAYLVGSLVLMVAGLLGAAVATEFTWLVVARCVQGVACAGIPACVQRLLGHHWAHRRRQVMGAWAASIGVGQAVGPPLGGLIAQVIGWRAVFVAVTVVVALCAVVITRSLPALTPRRRRLEVLVTVAVAGGAGATGTGAILLGQGVAGPGLALLLFGAAVVGVALRPGRTPPALGAAARDARYVMATGAAAVAMGVMSVTLVSAPIHLSSTLALAPATIGLFTFTMAVGMIVASPVAGSVAGRLGLGPIMAAGLLLLIAATLVCGALETTLTDRSLLVPLASAMFVVGCGIGVVQATAAALLTEAKEVPGLAMGVHNLGRFLAVALGQGWVALTVPLGHPLAVHAGSAGAAAAALGGLWWTRSVRRR